MLIRYQPDTGRFDWWLGDVEELAAIVLDEDDGLDDQGELADEDDRDEPDEEVEELDDEAQEDSSAAWDSQPQAPAGRYRGNQ